MHKCVNLLQDAYNSDSYDGSDWSGICEHVGLDLDRDGSIVGDETDESKPEDADVVETQNGAKHMEGRRDKIKNDSTDDGEAKVELRGKMKELRKILKTARKEINENVANEDLHETYKKYKHCAKDVKKTFRKLFDANTDLKDMDIVPGTSGVRRKQGTRNSDSSDTGTKMDMGSPTDIAKRTRRDTGRPISTTFQGQNRYKCPTCAYIGRSFGKVYSHMVSEHGAPGLRCTKCGFSTANPTSLHNHTKLYCSKIKGKGNASEKEK